MSNEADQISVYRIMFLLKGAKNWDLHNTEFMDYEAAKKIAQKIHDRFLGPNDESQTRIIIVKQNFAFHSQIVYDEGVAA